MRRRVLVTIMAITSLAVTAFGIPLGIAVASGYRSSARLELQREASAASNAVPASFATSGDPVELPRGVNNTTVGLYDVSGHLVAGDGPAAADAVVLAAGAGYSTDGSANGDIVAAVPISNEEVVVGIARAARAESVVRNQVWRAWGLMAGLGVIVVAAAAVVATWQSRRLSQPLEHLADAAQRLGDGDFTIQTERSGLPEIDGAGVALDRTAKSLGTMMERERQFTSDVSHQLRTPLTALRLTLENALTSPGVDPRDAIRDSVESMDRMEATIDDLISLRRPDGAATGPVDLGAILDEFEDTWRGPLAEGGRSLRVIHADTVDSIPVSSAAVRQILAVLLSNAAEHGTGTVEVSISTIGEQLQIDVSDEGAGLTIDPELAFRRRADRATGRGIGLPLAMSLAEAEGGRLVYRTDPTVLTVLLPFRLDGD